MSPNNVNDLASSFVQMAKAFEELPSVQDALTEAIRSKDAISNHATNLELSILNYKDMYLLLKP